MSSTVVNIIEHDDSARRALQRLFRSAGFPSTAFSSVDEFLASDIPNSHTCVVTDVHMPGISALELPNLLKERGVDIPVIFVTGDYSDATRDSIRRQGGCAYFKKPVDDQALIDMVRWSTGAD